MASETLDVSGYDNWPPRPWMYPGTITGLRDPGCIRYDTWPSRPWMYPGTITDL